MNAGEEPGLELVVDTYDVEPLLTAGEGAGRMPRNQILVYW